jgi:uncharacterized membrane protein YvbJ
MNCIQCGTENTSSAIACVRCGTTLDETTEYSADALRKELAAAYASKTPNKPVARPAANNRLFTVVIISVLVLLLIGGIILLVSRTGVAR